MSNEHKTISLKHYNFQWTLTNGEDLSIITYEVLLHIPGQGTYLQINQTIKQDFHQEYFCFLG